jgi:Cu(I)/Ag(I) efflux system periplasmic protein CusF
MKSVFAIVVATLLAASTSAIAQTATATPDVREKNDAYAEGEVRKVDKEAGKITLKHGPIANLDMPPMSMVFRAGEPAMLDKVKVGDKVRFKAEKIQGAITVTQIEPAK